MSIDLDELVRPEHTVLVTQECQEGVIGGASSLPQLARAARDSGAITRIASLVQVARAAGIQVVHCVVESRADHKGSNANARLFMAARRSTVTMTPGSPAAAVLSEIGVDEADIVLPRIHGLSPMSGTQLDPVLRHLGCRTIVAVGVSINIAITNFAFDAVNNGYQFVLPRDAVAGIPADYADAVVANTLSLIATITSTDDVARSWSNRS